MRPKKITILVVDDETIVLETMQELLSSSGYKVMTAQGGEKALEKLERHPAVDLIITDLMMPDMDGIALTKEIRNLGMQIPIIVITGFATIELAVETMKAGASDFITKPFNSEQIAITIKKVLETKKLERLASEREFYKQLSNRDAMTGLANYRACQEALTKEVERSKRYKHPLAIMMIDIDNFKVCNDTYGHLCGDTVLRQMAVLIKKQTRSSDFVARYGGEEFMVILPETPVAEALSVAERVREAIEGYRFSCEDDKPISALSVTIGLSALPDHAVNKKELIRTADAAMYQGKAAGKNRVVVFSRT